MGNLQYNLKKRNSYNPEKSSELTSNVTFSVSKCQNGKVKRKKMKHSKFEQTFFVHKFAILISLQENFVRKQAFLRQLAEILHHIKTKQ